jgi:uroporphyrinogen decarboxylase
MDRLASGPASDAWQEQETLGMRPRERVLASLEHQAFDRLPVKHTGTPEVDAALMAYFCVTEQDELLERLGDDFRYVAPVWRGPELRSFPDGSWEGYWGERYNDISFGEGTYPETVYLPFADVTDPDELAGYPFPRAGDFDTATLLEQCRHYEGYAIVLGGPGHFDFINGIARCRGVEQVLVDLATEDPVYLHLMEQRYQFFMEWFERSLLAAEDEIDFIHVGEDLGTQNGLLISPEIFERHFAPRFEALFALAHQHGVRTMMHICGSVRDLMPRLIEIGLDVLDVVQVGAAGMDLAGLKEDFGEQLCFCGTMDVQTVLPFGGVADVEEAVRQRLALFADGGLFLGPTHAIQVGTPLENSLAMYRAAGSLTE